MPDAFDEVEEALREDRASALWKRARPFVIGAVVLLVGGVAALEVYKWNRARTIDTQALQFQTALDALEKNDLPAAKASLESLRQGDGGFAALAAQLESQVELGLSRDPAIAAAPLLSVAERRDDIQGDIARLKAAYLRADALEAPELEKLVQPLVDKGGTVGALARELLAAKAFAGGDTAKARDLYSELAFDIEAPRGLQTRAQQMLTVVPAAPNAAAAAPASAPATAGNAPSTAPQSSTP